MEYGAKHLKLLDDIGVPHGMFIEALNKGGEMLDDIQTDIMLHVAQVRADSKTAGDLLSLIEKSHSSHEDGGPGSGNWGHGGRPGKRGGSAGGGGVHNRMTDNAGGFTSFSKQRKQASKPHVTNMKEVGQSPNGTKLFWGKSTFEKYSGGWIDVDTAEYFSASDMLANIDGEKVRYAIPKSASPNYNKPKKSGASSDDDRFSEERRKNAFTTDDPKQADALLRKKSGDIWKSCDEDTKNALCNYTGSSYKYINGSLRKNEFYNSATIDKVNRMTNAISGSKLDEDMWLFRGVNTNVAEKMFGLNDGDLKGFDWGDGKFDLNSLVGVEGTDKGFMSCGTIEGKGFSERTVQMKIYAPKGTEAIYAEPFSKLGSGAGRYWDGNSTQISYSSEFETIIQRGSTLKVSSAKFEEGKIKIEAMVVSQNYTVIPSE